MSLKECSRGNHTETCEKLVEFMFWYWKTSLLLDFPNNLSIKHANSITWLINTAGKLPFSALCYKRNSAGLDGEEASGFSLSFVLLCGDHALRSAECGSQEKWQWGSPQILLPAFLVCQPSAVWAPDTSAGRDLWESPTSAPCSRRATSELDSAWLTTKLNTTETPGVSMCLGCAASNGEVTRIS